MGTFREKLDPEIVLLEIKDRFDYSESSNGFIIKKSKQFKGKIGNKPGYLRKDKRRTISVHGVIYFEHHLIWLFFNGKFSDCELDHIDRNPENNKITNLRESSPSNQGANKKLQSNNKTGIKGVYYYPNKNKSKPYLAKIKFKRKEIHLGYYSSIEEATRVYDNKHYELFKEFGCTNKELAFEN